MMVGPYKKFRYDCLVFWDDEEYMVKVLSSVMKSELLSGRNKLESSRDLLNGGD